MQDPADGSDGSRVSAERRLGTAMAMALIVPPLLFALIAWQTHRTALDEAAARIDRVARVVHEHAARVFDTNTVILRQVEDMVGVLPDAVVEQAQAETNRRIAALATDVEPLSAVFVWSADGRPLLGTLPTGNRAIDVSAREFFTGARAAPGWSISMPTVSALNGDRFVALSRARRDAQGRFLGVASASLRVGHFESFYADLARDEPGLAVALLRTDGAVLARHPALTDPERARLDLLVPPHPADRGFGRYVAEAPPDGRRRMGSFSRVEQFPLVADVAIDTSAVLAEWRRTVSILAAVMASTALGLLFTLHLARVSVRRERAALQAVRDEALRRSRAEDALLQSQKLEAVGQLTGGVAHDFNNLLTVVTNNVFLLRATLPAGPSDAALASIERATAHGASLTRQLLAFSRRQTLNPVVIDPARHLPGLIDLLRATVGSRVSVGVHVDDGVAAVRVDPAELELALINLALNARDAMPGGGRIELAARRAGPDDAPRVAISVRDTGVGIAPEHRSRVLEPFFTTKPPGQGTGLGLSQVYGFATQAGGTVSIDCPSDGGTVVTLMLPAAAGPAAEDLPRPDVVPAKRTPVHVLLVEDDPSVAASTRAVIEGCGHRVTIEPSADAALASLSGGGPLPDLVISDVVMAGTLNGIDLALALRDAHPSLAVVLTTGYARDVERARAAGIAVLDKPCRPALLLDTIARHAKRPDAAPRPDAARNPAEAG